MSEREVIERTGNQPITVDSLCQDLIQLGVQPGMTLLVHSSLSALGWVCGGPVAVLLALEQALGESSTLVMPAHSGDLSDPAAWENPPVPPAWWDIIREKMPAYVSDLTPTRGMGVIVETFRQQQGVKRSQHPQVSFVARGPKAEAIVARHQLDYGLGETSPLAKVYRLGGWILLLGVGHASNTSLHLAEYRAQYQGKREIENGAPVYSGGHRTWVKIKDIDLQTEDFEQIGKDYLTETGKVSSGKVGLADAQLIPQPDLVDYAVKWIERHR
jgi:aminoglycoside 3-N-acetyltransferase